MAIAAGVWLLFSVLLHVQFADKGVGDTDTCKESPEVKCTLETRKSVNNQSRLETGHVGARLVLGTCLFAAGCFLVGGREALVSPDYIGGDSEI